MIIRNKMFSYITHIQYIRHTEATSNVLLSKMLDPDDCSIVPAVTLDYFDRDVISYAKKNHVYKNINYDDL